MGMIVVMVGVAVVVCDGDWCDNGRDGRCLLVVLVGVGRWLV